MKVFFRGPDISSWRVHAVNLKVMAFYLFAFLSYYSTVTGCGEISLSFLVSIHISSVTSDVECVSLCLFAISMLSLVKCFVGSSQYLDEFKKHWTESSFWYFVKCVTCTCIIPFCSLSFHPLHTAFWEEYHFNADHSIDVSSSNQVFIVKNSVPDVASSRVLLMFCS